MRGATAVRASAVIGWGLTALAAPSGGTLPPVLSPGDDAGGAAVSLGLWGVTAVVTAALVLPGARALTIVRIAVPAAAVLQLWSLAAAAASDSGSGGLNALGGVSAAVSSACALIVLMPAYSEAQVDAASYGDERRFLLRPPGPVLVTLVAPLWAVSAVGVVAGPLLLAHQDWALGAAVTAVGLPAAAAAAHALYRLSRRWLVFVPNGIVIHDHLALSEPLPLRRRDIASLAPARADTSAEDLTAQAFGIALELRPASPLKARVVTGRNRGEERAIASMLVSASRPASVLHTARRRGIKVT